MSNTKNLFTDTIDWLFDLDDWKKLLRSIPGLVTTLSIMTVTIMNLMAGKVVLTTPYIGITGGFILSWLPFLLGDIIVKTYGAKAATKINMLGLIINLCCVGLFQLVSCVQVGGDASQYTAFDSTFKQTWQIFVASSIAFIVSGVINNYTNAGIGSLFKENPDSKKAYMCRTYISTMLGQFFDNFLFTYLAFMVFFRYSVGSSFGYTLKNVAGTALLGAFIEMLMEVIFSPIGYSICMRWRKEGVGKEYLEYCEMKESKKDIGRINY